MPRVLYKGLGHMSHVGTQIHVKELHGVAHVWAGASAFMCMMGSMSGSQIQRGLVI